MIGFSCLEDDNYHVIHHYCQLNDLRVYQYYDSVKKSEIYVIVFKYTDLSYFVSKDTFDRIKSLMKIKLGL